MERFVENRGKAPTRVVIYRSGTSHTGFSNIHRYEIPYVLLLLLTFITFFF